MHRHERHHASEAAATSLEFVGIAVAASLLLGGMAAALAPQGRSLGTAVARQVGELVGGEQPTRRWRDVREWRTGGGDAPVRVSRDELRMTPVLDPLALWDGRWQREGELGAGVRGSIDASACVGCASLEWSHELAPGATAGSDGAHAGLRGSVEASGRVALASAQVDGRVERDLGQVGEAFAQGRLRGTIGAEADASLRGRISRDTIDLEADAGAMAGAVARAEARTGIDLLGVAIRQSGRVEGWAGAGARGTAGVRSERGIVSWRLGWGAALGLGGAGEWSGSVDASKVPASHRRLARDALVASLRVTGIDLTPIPPFS